MKPVPTAVPDHESCGLARMLWLSGRTARSGVAFTRTADQCGPVVATTGGRSSETSWGEHSSIETPLITRIGANVTAVAVHQVRSEKHERPLEKAVSKIIGEMHVLWLAVGDEPGPENRRKYIERNAIALLSNHDREALDSPSDGWLGLNCPSDMVARSGLWNQQDAEKAHDRAFLPVLERLVEEQSTAGTCA